MGSFRVAVVRLSLILSFPLFNFIFLIRGDSYAIVFSFSLDRLRRWNRPSESSFNFVERPSRKQRRAGSVFRILPAVK